MCRLMFDALEHTWRKEPGHATLIQDLYKGTMQDWLKCLKYQTERVKEDAFLDLPLAVRPFDATEAHKSVVRFEFEAQSRARTIQGGTTPYTTHFRRTPCEVKPDVLHGDN
jgi:ubiquitin carboxyl-terminal hydrolase 47